MSLDGTNWHPLGIEFVVYAPLTVHSLEPAVLSATGGATLRLAASNLFASPDLFVKFVKGATSLTLPAAFDEASASAVVSAPAWAPATALLAAYEKAKAAAEAASSAEGAAPVEPPPPPALTDAEEDAIVELSVNGQQWTTDCKHVRFVLDPVVQALEPSTAPIEGQCPLKLTGLYFVETGCLKVRFTKLAPYEEGTTPALPPDATYLEVDVTCNDGAVGVVAPAFEGVADSFAAAVQLSADGQTFGPTFAVLKYEAVAAKGGKKK